MAAPIHDHIQYPNNTPIRPQPQCLTEDRPMDQDQDTTHLLSHLPSKWLLLIAILALVVLRVLQLGIQFNNIHHHYHQEEYQADQGLVYDLQAHIMDLPPAILWPTHLIDRQDPVQ